MQTISSQTLRAMLMRTPLPNLTLLRIGFSMCGTCLLVAVMAGCTQSPAVSRPSKLTTRTEEVGDTFNRLNSAPYEDALKSAK